MYQGRTLKVLGTLLPLTGLAMLMVCKVASAQSVGPTLIFNYPSASASSAIQLGASATFQGSAINLTSGSSQHQGGGAGYKAQQNISSFATQFTFQLGISGQDPSIQCIAFVIQNTNATHNPLSYGAGASDDANLCGYGSYALSGQYSMMNSVGVTFNLNGNGQNNYPSGGSPSSTGLYINGGPTGALLPEIDLNPSGINFYSGHVMAVNMVYDGSILTMTLQDTVTHAQFRTSWPVNIPAIVGSNSAWVGFTAGEIPAPVSNDILTWTFTEGYAPRLASPVFSVAGGSYSSAQSVSISAAPGATIYFTTNGQQPTSSSSTYTGPISVGSSEIVQAIAVESGSTDSLVAVANYQIGPSGTPVINFPGGFASASNLITAVGHAKFSGSQIQLTDTNSAGSEAGAAWYSVPVSVGTFSTNFTLQFTNANANGVTFCIQNQPPASSDTSILSVSGGPDALGGAMNGLGYADPPGTGVTGAGLQSSVAVKFDVYSGNTTGIYTNGALPSTPQTTITGVTLNSGHPINVTLSYDGANLSMTLTDTVTSGTFSTSFPINIPSTVGGSTAYVGFTGSTGGLYANQFVNSWTYSASTTSSPPVAVPAAPTNLQVQ
jgi:hypothetical protein